MTSEDPEGEILKDETAHAAFVNTRTNPPITGEERLPMVKFWMLASAFVLAVAALVLTRKRSRR